MHIDVVPVPEIAHYQSRQILTRDHEEMDLLLARYVAACTADPDTAYARWHAFSAALRRHMDSEERVLFPAYQASVRPPGGGPLTDLRRQHRAILSLLKILEAGLENGMRPEVRQVREHELMRLLWAHEANEEAVFIPWMRACLIPEERRRLEALMQAAPVPGAMARAQG